MKHIKPKYILAISLLALTANSAQASMSGVGSPAKIGKGNPELLLSPKFDKNHKKRAFLERHKKKVGYDTNSVSEFFKRLRPQKKASPKPST